VNKELIELIISNRKLNELEDGMMDGIKVGISDYKVARMPEH